MNTQTRSFSSGLLIVLCLVAAMFIAIASTAALDSDEDAEAAAYCADAGGTVVTRYAAYGTNNPLTMTRYAHEEDYCEFVGEDESRISLPVDDLYADAPTLAALAYLNPPAAEDSTNPGANPAYRYCTQIGGAIAFGLENASGSGWVNVDDDADVAAMCVFADGSMLDSFGLFYHSADIVRGADLTTLFRWQPE
jgi:putative hemolysin